jgi:hypothetical protein
MSAVTVEAGRGRLLASSGLLFVAFFIASLVLGGVLASSPLPMPDAPAAQTARYYDDSRTAILVGGLLQALSAVSLLVFTLCVAAVVRRGAGDRGALSRLALGGGALAAVFLLLSVVFSAVLALVAAGENLALVDALRDLNFLAGGADHVSMLGIFVGTSSVAASRAKALPRWISWLGFLAATLSLLSLASLVWFPATVLLPLGRLLSFAWSIAMSVVLIRGGGRIGTDVGDS